MNNLTHSFAMHRYLPPENIRLMFSGGSERVHWEQMHYYRVDPPSVIQKLSRTALNPVIAICVLC